MKCPTDQTILVMTERQGIEIDYCPSCRGVWLDRGELDKLIAGGAISSSKSSRVEQQDQLSHSDTRLYPNMKHKKESFLSELFDF